ncbi:MAG: hypothetical protein ACKORF_01755 [Micrococcales bacterium]
MRDRRLVRGLARDRHARGIRRPLWSNRFQPGMVRLGSFQQTIDDAADYLRGEWPELFGQLRVVVNDLPPIRSSGLNRWSASPSNSTIYLYRIPIQRLGQLRDPIEEMFRIESIVIEAAAALVDRDPRDFWQGRD